MDHNEKHLINQIKMDNPQGLKDVYKTYYNPLFVFAQSYLRDTELARDIVQMTFIKVWEKRHELNPELPLTPYLFQIIRNRCINEIKYQNAIKRQVKVSSNQIDTDDPLSRLIQCEKIGMLTKIISELPVKCREIFELSRFSGLKYHEIAEKLQISVKTVETQMGIALKKIRCKYSE
jgi:RNA polymerase sigma-70 factor (family 1)